MEMDALRQPLAVIDDHFRARFQEACQQQRLHQPSDFQSSRLHWDSLLAGAHNAWGATATLASMLSAGSAGSADAAAGEAAAQSGLVAWHIHVPLISRREDFDALPAGSLVRFRGMVQDQLGSEIFAGICEDAQSPDVPINLFFRDLAPATALIDSQRVSHGDREVLFCIPVPGLSDWCATSSSLLDAVVDHDSQISGTTTPRTQRKRSVDVGVGDGNEGLTTHTTPLSPQRQRVEEARRATGRHGPSVAAEAMQDGDVESGEFGRLDTNTAGDVFATAVSVATSFPLLTQERSNIALPCIVKLYDQHCSQDEDGPEVGRDHSRPRLNDMFEFVGVLSADPLLEALPSSTEAFPEEMRALHPPSSIVPRLHCLSLRKLSLGDLYIPLDIIRSLPVPEVPMLTLRHHLHGYFKAALGGDDLAAEYLLMSALARVKTRTDSFVLGKLSLNLTEAGASNGVVEGLSSLLSTILPVFHCASMTVQDMNSRPYAPRRDHSTNRLVSGMFQLPDGAYLMFDETKLTDGQLSAIGARNVRSLQRLLSEQQVGYNYEFCKLDIPTDIRCLVVSPGRRSIIGDHFNLVLPLRSSCEASCAPLRPAVISSDFLLALRTYFARADELASSYSVDSSLAQELSESFVERRLQEDDLPQSSFAVWLDLARLHTVASGLTQLTMEIWRHVLESDAERRARLRASNQVA